MSDNLYSAAIRNLFQEYYKRNINIAEYRSARKKILSQLDRDYNGQVAEAEQNSSAENNQLS